MKEIKTDNIQIIQYKNGKQHSLKDEMVRMFHFEKRDFKNALRYSHEYIVACLEISNTPEYAVGINTWYFRDNKNERLFPTWKRALISQPVIPASIIQRRRLNKYLQNRIKELKDTSSLDTFYVFAPYKIDIMKRVLNTIYSEYVYYRDKVGNTSILSRDERRYICHKRK